MMMSHGGELLARYRGLNHSHHEYVLSADSRLKGYEEKSKAKGKEKKKKIKSLTKSLDNLHTEVARLSVDLNRATILEAEKDEEIRRLKATPLENRYLRKGQKSKQNDKTKHENGNSVKEKSKLKPSEKSTVKVNPAKSRKEPRKSKAKIKDLGGQERLKAEMMLGFSSQEKHNKHKKEKTKDLTAYILKKRTEDKVTSVGVV
ncbi:hypothetical protein Tco_0889382 [Tanacetum coccineum]